MDKLRGVDSLPVVLHRFSNGVEVVKCVVDFCNEVAMLERSYSESLHRLLRSSSYTFHSNLLFQWLGNDPYVEIGSLKHSWQELGQELCKLADLHSEQAEAYQNSVRKPLQDLLPQLEEARRNMRLKVQQIKSGQEQALKKMNREKQKYVGLGENCERLQNQIRSLKSTGVTAKIRLSRLERRLDTTERQLHEQEQIYRTVHSHCLEVHREFEEEIQDLYKKHHEREMKRVNALKEALLNFTKTLSNTAPAYLEGMKRIHISVDKIDAASDIQWFVNEHSSLQTSPQLPPFEIHSFIRVERSKNGRQSPIGGEEERDGEAEGEGEGEGGSPETKRDRRTGLKQVKPDSTTSQTGNSSHSGGLGERRAGRKWPLEGIWGGIRGKLRTSESGNGRGRAEREDSDEEEGEEEDVREESEGECDESGVHLSGEREKRDDHSQSNDSHKTVHSCEKSLESGSSENRERESRSRGLQEVRARGAEDAEGGGAKPAPNPKPNKLRSARGSEGSSGSEGVKFSSLSGSLRLEGSESQPERPPLLKSGPQGQTGPPLSKGGPQLGKAGPPMTNSGSPLGKRGPHGITRPHNRTNLDGRQHLERVAAVGTPQRKRRPELESESDVRDTTSHTKPLLPTLPVVTGNHDERSSSRHPKPPPPTKPANLDKPVHTDTHSLLKTLQEKAGENDYYRLFGVESTASTEELARMRREMSRQLHPDHFAGQPGRQERAQQQLMLINQVFQDVLKSIETRSLYDQLCQFRQHYGRIPDQKQRGLQVAHSKLSSLHKQLKKHRAPLPLLSELTTALSLITACQKTTEHSALQ